MAQAGELFQAKEEILKTKNNLKIAQYALKPLYWLRVIPKISNEVKIASQVLEVSPKVLALLDEAFNLAQSVLGLQKDNPLNTLSVDKGKIIINLALNQEEIESIEKKAQEIQKEFLRIDFSKSPRIIKEKGILLGEKINDIMRGLQELRFASETLPAFIGYPEERTYLFLFQNNTELRPSGGFLGTYGIIKLKNGEIVEFFTDDTYNLDKPYEYDDSFQMTPPEPLQVYNADEKWTFRDSNWSPDFVESSKKMLEFYKLEKGKDASNLDGVIAITPTVIEGLLKLTGPIKVDGYPYEFTAENFTDQLEMHVEKNYANLGEEKEERKSIIGKMGEVLIDKLFKLQAQDIFQAIEIAEKNLTEKHILLYSFDNTEEKRILERNWGGAVNSIAKNNSADFLMVVDANLGSLKSDYKVKRKIEYSLDDNKANLKINYDHQGKFDWKTTRYRTWTRVYAPKGSELIAIKGNESNLKIYQDLDKTVFAFFKSIEPQTQESVEIQYKLPENIDLKNYSLYIQKQAGAINNQLKIKINNEKKIEWEGSFEKDQEFNLKD